MVTRLEIVAEARSWIGTRYQHQASVKGVACDCVGFVRGVGMALGLLQPDFLSLPEVRKYAGYGRVPSGDRIMQGCVEFATPVAVEDAAPGDILLMRFKRDPQHLAIVTDRGMIHSYAGAGKVVEHRIDEQWASRIVAAYSYRGVDA